MGKLVCRSAATICQWCFAALAIAFLSVRAAAQVNAWTNATSGSWDDPSAWSLGVVPGSSQSIVITNSGWKAVAINPSTPINFPDSMTIADLTIRGAWDTENTLLLNFLKGEIPLVVSNGLTLQDGGRIVNFDSGLIVKSGIVSVTNAQIFQDGGFLQTTNAPMNFFNSAFYLTNGVFEAGTVSVGLQNDSHIIQYGGVATIAQLVFPFIAEGGSGSRGYSLFGGSLNLPNGLRLEGRGGSRVAYRQDGGTNRTTIVLLEPGLTGPSPEFTLNGGLLVDAGVQILADTINTRIQQNGGTHSISNSLQLLGGARTGQGRTALYQLNDGTLTARSIELEGQAGPAAFVQSNGIAHAEEIRANGYWIFQSDVTLAGGALSCSNLSALNGANLHQFGGLLVISNELSCVGYREPGPKIYSRYELLGGMLVASNISIDGDWIIGDSVTNRISNSGTVTLAHTLQISNAIAQLGRLILTTNATIDMAGQASRLNFADSSGEGWGSGATLNVMDWNGNAAGGGDEQITFGDNESGLTPQQLSRIRFQLSTNSWPAKILNTGEVVPDVAIPTLAFVNQGNRLVLTWPPGSSLQTATNVAGPYLDLLDATSPYTNEMWFDPQRFFRLRH